jgi:hypothetical protein
MKSIMIALLLATSTCIFGQDINLEQLRPGTEKTFPLKSEDGTVYADLIVKKLDSAKSGIAFDFSKSGKKNYLLEIIKNSTIIHSQKVKGGPDADLDLSTEKQVVHSWVASNEPDAWWGVLLVAYCCLELSVSHTSNSDGTSSTTTTIGFDCDCFSIGGLVTTESGGDFYDVDEIRVTPLN